MSSIRDSIKATLKKAGLFGVALEAVTAWRRLLYNARRGFGRVDRALVRGYLAAPGPKKLHLGCGPREIGGWLNADLTPATDTILRLDASRPFCFADDSFDYVFSEHMIEHIDYGSGAVMLAECFRILKPGGRIRISTPDLAKILALYEDDSEFSSTYMRWYSANLLWPPPPYPDAVFMVNRFLRDWGHQFVYDRSALSVSMRNAGFVRIAACELQQSDDPVFRGLEREERMPAGYLRYETFTLEAEKPATKTPV